MNSLDTPGTGFADRQLVRDFLATGILPGIHDTIGALLNTIPLDEREGALDLGACTGLITVRLARMGFSPVLGVEPNLPDVEVFREHLWGSAPQSDIVVGRLNPMNEPQMVRLSNRMKRDRLTTVVARRILPEIMGGTVDPKDINTVHPEAGVRVGRALLDGGATRLVIEGRVPSPRARHDLSSVEQEIVALSRHWVVAERLKACAILIPR